MAVCFIRRYWLLHENPYSWEVSDQMVPVHVFGTQINQDALPPGAEGIRKERLNIVNLTVFLHLRKNLLVSGTRPTEVCLVS